MKEHNVVALYEVLAKIFELREDCKITIKSVKANTKNTNKTH